MSEDTKKEFMVFDYKTSQHLFDMECVVLEEEPNIAPITDKLLYDGLISSEDATRIILHIEIGISFIARKDTKEFLFSLKPSKQSKCPFQSLDQIDTGRTQTTRPIIGITNFVLLEAEIRQNLDRWRRQTYE